MADPSGRPPVTVGLGGGRSDRWTVLRGVREARAREVPLRLVHCAPFLRAPTGAALHQRARDVLDRARTTARGVDRGVVVTTELVADDPVPGLLREAAHSTVLLLGTDDPHSGGPIAGVVARAATGPVELVGPGPGFGAGARRTGPSSLSPAAAGTQRGPHGEQHEDGSRRG